MPRETLNGNGVGVQQYTWYSIPTASCKDVTYHQAYQTLLGYRDVPVRPDRRPKPSCLVCNVTARGPFESYIRTAKITTAYSPPQSLICNGTSTTRSTLYNHYDLGSAFPAAVTVPSTALALRNQIKSARVNMAESIGEWKETARAVEGGAGALSRAFSDLRRIAKLPRRKWPRELRKALKDRWGYVREDLSLHTVPAAYVVTQYGILPYVQLANQSIDALQARGQEVSLVKVYRQRRSVTRNSVVKGTYGGECKTKKTVKVYSVAYVTYYKDLGTFTSGNMGESLWAGLPASFMIDWFYGIGQWLSAIDALDGVRSYTGTTTVRTDVTSVDKRIEYRPLGWTALCKQPGRVTQKVYQRSSLSLAMPALPEWKVSASWGKLMSSLALLDVLRVNSSKHARH